MIVDDVAVDGLAVGVSVTGATRITLRRVGALNSPTSWGVDLADCEDVTLDQCRAAGNWRDGFKLRKNTRRVDLLHCTGKDNGRGSTAQPPDYGDGLDVYAGGQQFRITGGDYSGNGGYGIQVKTGPLNDAEGEQNGKIVGDAVLVGVRCEGNTFDGMIVTTVDFANPAASVPRNLRLIGCLLDRNGRFGLQVSAVDGLTATNCSAVENGKGGLVTGARAKGVRFVESGPIEQE